MDKLPAHFRDKWSRLSLIIDPTGQSLAKIVGEASGLSDNPDQGQTFKFQNGALVSYGINTAPILIYGDIYHHWDSLAGLNSGYGHPIADPQFLPDGSICSIFEGGHVHRPPGGREMKVEAFPPSECPAPDKPPLPAQLSRGSRNWPTAFRQKWSWLSVQRDPYGKQFAELIGSADLWPHDWPGLTENDNGGRTLHFRTGKLVSLWLDIGGVMSGLGHPLADPQFLEDGSICSVFEGGHIHQIGARNAEVFPASQCIAEQKPTVPPAVVNASVHWPRHFRQKWTSLSVESDARGQQLASLLGPTDCFPYDWPGLTDNDNGGKTLHFRYGKLISNTYQSPPFLVYGKIYDLWHSLGDLNSGFGFPLGDPQILQDGSTCSIFEGGHIHQAGTRDAEIFPASECTAENQPAPSGAIINMNPHWPASFRSKWMSLAWQRDHSGKQLAGLLGPTDCFPFEWPGLTDNEDGGKTLHFRNGQLISYDNQSPPFLVYGNIFNVWKNLGGIKSDMKYPLADPQFLSDESICAVFEGGHIHQPRGSKDADVHPANNCTAPYRPTSRTSLASAPIPPAAQVPVLSAQSFTPPVQDPTPPVQDFHPSDPQTAQPPVQDHQSPHQDFQSPHRDSQPFHQAFQPSHQSPVQPPSQIPAQIPAQPLAQPPAQIPTQIPAQPLAQPSSQHPVQDFQPPNQDVQSPGGHSSPGAHPHPASQHQQYTGARHGHSLGSAMTMVGKGIRTLGAGMNKVADAIEKRNQL